MKLAFAFLFALLPASVALAAQSAGTAGMEGLQTNVVQLPPMNSVCPVSLHAQHGAGGDLLRVNRHSHSGLGQAVHLILTSPDSRTIVEAKVMVYGLSGKNRLTPALSNQDDSDATYPLVVKFTAGDKKSASSDLWVPGMTATLSVDLESVTFADGSTWKLQDGKTCRTPVDPLMLVSGH